MCDDYNSKLRGRGSLLSRFLDPTTVSLDEQNSNKKKQILLKLGDILY